MPKIVSAYINIVDTICEKVGRFKRSLSVTKRGLLIFKFKQASVRSSILPDPNQIVVG